MPIDYSKYPDNWKTEIVPRILKRADNKCENCGVGNHEIVWSGKIYTRQKGRYSWRTLWFTNWVDLKLNRSLLAPKVKLVEIVLTIAHLDHDEGNKDVKDERLKALCQKCHLGYDAEEKYRRAVNK